MLLGIIGPKCSGKKSASRYLVKNHQFTELIVDSSSSSPNSFKSLDHAIAYATTRWTERMLITNIDRFSNYDLLFKRPFFLLIWIDAPTSVRFQRFQSIQGSDEKTLCVSNISLDDDCKSSSSSSLAQFLQIDETSLYQPFGKQTNTGNHIYNHSTCLYDFIAQAHLRLINNTKNKQDLTHKLDMLDLLNPEHTRPTWDTYFMALCELAAKRSNCMKRRVGCIIVADARVISTGYNGTPKGLKNCSEGGCLRCNGNAPCGSSLDHCICLHAEEVSLH